MKSVTVRFNAEPLEMHNVADDPAHAGLLQKLRTRLNDLQKETHDTLDLDKTSGQRKAIPSTCR